MCPDDSKVSYLQRESLVSGLALLVPTSSQGSYQGLQGRAQTPAARGVQATGVSEALRVCVQTFLVP